MKKIFLTILIIILALPKFILSRFVLFVKRIRKALDEIKKVWVRPYIETKITFPNTVASRQYLLALAEKEVFGSKVNVDPKKVAEILCNSLIDNIQNPVSGIDTKTLTVQPLGLPDTVTYTKKKFKQIWDGEPKKPQRPTGQIIKEADESKVSNQELKKIHAERKAKAKQKPDPVNLAIKILTSQPPR